MFVRGNGYGSEIKLVMSAPSGTIDHDLRYVTSTPVIYLFIYLFSIPEIHQSGYRTCHYIAVGRVQNEARQ